jgi:hypothetical protein
MTLRVAIVSLAGEFAWGTDAPGPGVPDDHFAAVTTSTVDLPAGTYELWAAADYGVRLFVDGVQGLGYWGGGSMSSCQTQVRLAAGRHNLRLEYSEVNGPAKLEFSMRGLPD